jgi:SNF2 family DNA or RNA helicase
MSTASGVSEPSDISLHGLWSGTSFSLFGLRAADATEQEEIPTKPRGSKDSAPPWALSPAELHEIAGERSPDGLLASAAGQSSIELWLPFAEGAQKPLREGDANVPKPTLRNVVLPAITFAPADSVDFLISLSATASHPISDSLTYWGILARWMLTVLERQQFCPDAVEQAGGGWEGRWRLLVNDRRELIWLERFVAVMPPICRAMSNAQGIAADATRLVETFLAEGTDALIRRGLSSDPFFQQIHRRARETQSWEMCWLSSLIGANRAVRGAEGDPSAVMSQVRDWLLQADGEAEEPAPRLCFALHEPPEDSSLAGPCWRLTFELRSADGEVVLDIPKAWAERGGVQGLLGSRLSTRRQHLSSQLRRAAQIVPELGRSSARASGGVDLTTAEAHAFLRERAPLLSAQDFEVTLPDWVTRGQALLGLRLHVRPHDAGNGNRELSLGRLGLGSLLDFDWRVAVGQEQLSLEEFERLTANKAPLIKIRGEWIDIDRDSAEQALEFMRRQAGKPITLLSAIRLAGGAEEFDPGLPILGLTGADWVEQFLRESPDVALESFDPPPDFNGTLRPYQLRGLHWLAFLDQLGIGSCLADDMGLGKTIQLLALLLHERREGQTVGPTLLFAPMSVVGNWEREIQRFAKRLRVLVYHGPARLTGDAFVEAARRHDVVLTTYGLASRELKDFSRVSWHRIAMDEAQKIKNPSANQTVALRSLTSTHRVALTGTPIENHLSELWSIMEMLNPGLLGSASSFRNRFAVPIEKLGDRKKSEQLRQMIRPFVLRRLKSDPLVACDLPEKMDMRVYCNLTPEQAALYERTVNDTLLEVDSASGIRRRGMILAALTKLKQICNHPAHLLRTQGPLDGRSGKCERLVEMLEEVLEEGDAALVFTQFKEMGTLLKKLLEDRLQTVIPFLHGGTTMKKRNEMILEFQDAKGPTRIFLLSLKAGGFGLNLTKANHVFHFDRWWNPAVEEQAADRAHRIGQTRRVQVHKFVCIGTVEERIDRLLAEKALLADRIVGSGDEWLTGLLNSRAAYVLVPIRRCDRRIVRNRKGKRG